MEDYIYIGRVANTHGVRGMLKILPTTDDPKRFELLDFIYIENSKGKTEKYTISHVKYLKQFVLLQLKEIESMDDAIPLKTGIVKIPRELALPLADNEYYVSDLIGLDVFDDEGNFLGPLKDVIFTGSNDVYVVDNGSKNGLLLPVIPECVLDVDIENKKVIVHLLEGLLDL